MLRLLKLNETVNRMCGSFVKWKIKFRQGDVPEHCAPSQTTVALGASSIIERQGLKVRVHPSIEPSVGGGERWACRQAIEKAGVFDSQSQCCCVLPHMAKGILLCSC